MFHDTFPIGTATQLEAMPSAPHLVIFCQVEQIGAAPSNGANQVGYNFPYNYACTLTVLDQ